MKLIFASLLFASQCSAFSPSPPLRPIDPSCAVPSLIFRTKPCTILPPNSPNSPNSPKSLVTPLSMISDGTDRRERHSLDISKTTYTSSVKSPKDAYIAFADKGMSNARMHWMKILHQSIMGGAYVGFGGLLALSVAGNIGGIGASNPGMVKMAFAALFPVNLLLIVMTGGQLFTGNSSSVVAARLEGQVSSRELAKSLVTSLVGNVIGCGVFAMVANYVGLLQGGTGALAAATAVGKVGASFGVTFTKAILCNWMVSLAVFMAGASNDLAGKLVGCWFPISTFVAIGLEHSIANLFVLPAAILIGAKVTVMEAITKNLIPVILGNAFAGAFIVAASYSFQFGRLGAKGRKKFRAFLKEYDERKEREAALKEQHGERAVSVPRSKMSVPQLINEEKMKGHVVTVTEPAENATISMTPIAA